jgi:hypothetical protein
MFVLMIVVSFDLGDDGAGQKVKSTQKDKRSQHNNSHGHLPPCFLYPHSSPHLCVSFWSILELLLQWSPWYWGSLWSSFLAEVCVILLVSKNMMPGWSFGLGEFPWKTLLFLFLFIVVRLGLERNGRILFWDPKPLPFTTYGSPICLLPSPATCSSPSSSTHFLILPPKL